MSEKVLIIGAGPAGITAGLELQKFGYNVTILEETDSVGGISKTAVHGKNRMDMGGHRFFSKDERVMKWWIDLLPLQGAPSMDDEILGRDSKLFENGPDPKTCDDVMLVRNRVSRIYYNKHFFDYPISMKFSTVKNLGFFTTMMAGFSYLKSCIIKRQETNLENFYINRFGKVLYKLFFEGYTEKLWGRHPRDISADWGAQRVKGLSILAVIKDVFRKIFGGKNSKTAETSLIEEFYYPKFGPGHLWETAVKNFESLGGTVIKNCKVEKIEFDGEKITKVIAGDKVFAHDIVLSSMPLKDLVCSMQGAPSDVCSIAKNLPYRDFITAGLLVDKLQIKNKTNIKTLGDIVPDCWIYVQDCFVKLGRIQIFNNWSPYLVENPENTVWIGLEYFCTEGDELWQLNSKEFSDFAIEELVKMGIIESADIVKDTHVEKVKKAYPAYFDTYAQIDDVIDYLNKFINLYCIGRNGQHRYNNMDHSMATAFETVKNITTNKKDKSNIWNVNTDKEYHEEK